jgi:hypothetical protein
MEFKSVEFMTAKEKELVYKQWKAFVDSNFAVAKFTKRLYNHLHLHCGFIAHYDQGGFYHVYFGGSGDDAMRFMHHFTEPCRDYWLCGDYEDINRKMCVFITEHRERIMKKFSSAQMAQDLLKAKMLLSKYGMEIKE